MPWFLHLSLPQQRERRCWTWSGSRSDPAPLEHLQRDTLREQQGRAGVPQVVEAYIGQTRSLERSSVDEIEPFR